MHIKSSSQRSQQALTPQITVCPKGCLRIEIAELSLSFSVQDLQEVHEFLEHHLRSVAAGQRKNRKQADFAGAQRDGQATLYPQEYIPKGHLH